LVVAASIPTSPSGGKGRLRSIGKRANIRLEIDSTVGKFAEGSSLLELSGLLGVLRNPQKRQSRKSRKSREKGISASFTVIRGPGKEGTYVFVSHDCGVVGGPDPALFDMRAYRRAKFRIGSVLVKWFEGGSTFGALGWLGSQCKNLVRE